MKIEVLSEYGYNEALLGISLSRDQPLGNMSKVAQSLCDRDGGHNKFLEFIAVWIDITAPRFWWQQMATYRIGNSFQSQSTMYTLTKNKLTQQNFEYNIEENYLNYLNNLIESRGLIKVKNLLPEGFLQRRIMFTNYKSLRTIYHQRHNHKLPQWKTFCSGVSTQLDYPLFILQ